MLRRITTMSTNHRVSVFSAWVIVVLLAALVTPGLFDRLISDGGEIEGTESQRGNIALWEAAPSGESIYAIADGRPATDPALRESVLAVARQLNHVRGVAEIRHPWSNNRRQVTPLPEGVASDGQAVAMEVVFDPTPAGEDAVDDAAELLRSIDAPHVVVGGGPILDEEMGEQAASDLARAELLTTPVLIVLLLVIFGSVIAAGLPLLIALVAGASTLGSLFVFSLIGDVSVYAVNIVTMLGLGLAIDYALLIVSRYREERARGLGPQDAVHETMRTAGRTVLFSGLTVAASLGGLLVLPDEVLRSLGFAGLSVVLLDMAAALTLLPALLMSLRHRIKPAKAPRTSGGVIARIARGVGARPVLPLVAVVGLLVLTAIPFAGARFADPDETSMPESSQSRELAELAQDRFAEASSAEPITVVGPGEWATSDRDAYLEELTDLAGVRVVTTRDGVPALAVRDGVPSLTVIDVIPEGESQGRQAIDLVAEIRSLDPGVHVDVTGDAAELVDYQQALGSRIPWAIGLVALASFILLFLFTGSVVVPLKALVMNVLSLGASFGVLVWVFQDGHLGRLVGTDALGSLSMSTPTLVFAIAFGLSMDYEVFLLGRISEIWRQTGDTSHAIVTGLQRTGRIVTAAALLMVVVYAGFVAGGFSPVKQVGLGLVLAVAVDATLVRLVLLPAVMTMMGRLNWWAPAPLRRLHQRLGMTEQPGEIGGPNPGDARPVPGRARHVRQALTRTGTSPM